MMTSSPAPAALAVRNLGRAIAVTLEEMRRLEAALRINLIRAFSASGREDARARRRPIAVGRAFAGADRREAWSEERSGARSRREGLRAVAQALESANAA